MANEKGKWIQILRPFSRPGREFTPGQTVELSAADADALIAMDADRPLAKEVPPPGVPDSNRGGDSNRAE